MKRPKTIFSNKKIWFCLPSIFLLVVAFALSMASSSMAATGSFDRESYLPDLGSNDFDRAWISVTDSSGNTTNSQDSITVTINAKGTSNSTSFVLKETGATTTVFTSSGSAQPAMYPVGSTTGYVEDFNIGSHNFPGLGASVVGLNLKELSANNGGDATTGTDGNLTVESGNTLELLYGGSTLDTAVVKSNSGSFTFTPSAVSAITTDSSVGANLIVSVADQDENLDPVARDVIGFADNSAALSGSPGTGSSRVQIEAIDQTTGSTLSLGGTSIVARNILLTETGNNTGVFTASGKVFGTSTTLSSSDLKGNVLVGSSSTTAYAGSSITLGNTSTGPSAVFKIIEVNNSGRVGLYESASNQFVLGYVSPASGTFVGTSSLSITKVVAMGTTTSLFGTPNSAANQGTNTSGLLKLIDGSTYCLVAIESFKAGASAGTVSSTFEASGNGGSVTVSLSSFQLAGPRSGDTLKVSYLDELNGGGVSGTGTASLTNGVSGVTGTLAQDNSAPDINDLLAITVVDANLNTSTSSKESVSAGSSQWGGTTTNNRGDRLSVKSYNAAAKTISLSHPDGFAVGTQTVRVSNTDNSLVWIVPSSLSGTFNSPLSVGSTTFGLGTQSVSTIPLVRGSSSTADSFLSSASTSSFTARLDGLDNTVEISPDGTRWISIPVIETGANSSTFIGTVGFDFTAARLTTSTSTSITTLISDFSGTSTVIFQDGGFAGNGIQDFIGTGSVVRIFDGSAQEFAEVCSSAATTLSLTKLSNSTAFNPSKTWVQVIGNDMVPERLDTTSDGTSLFRIGGYCDATYRVRYNDALGAGNVYMGGDTLAVTTDNMGFTTNTGSLSTNVTGSSGPDTFIVVTVVDQDLNTTNGSKQTTSENDSATDTKIFDEEGLGLPSGSSTGNASRGFKNGGTSKIVYASTLSTLRSSSLNLSSGGNAIDFTLTETANDSGTFKGSFQLSSGTSTTNSSDLLKVSNGNVVTVFYIDAPTGGCESIDTATDPLTIVTSLGTLSLSKDSAYLSGDTVVATVVDVDRNSTKTSADTLTTALKVTGSNYSVGTDLSLNLVETGVDTSTFVATFKTGTTTDSTTSPQTLKAVQAGIANVVYTDTSPQASSAVAQVLFTAGDATMSFTEDSYGLNTFAVITLSDSERNTSITASQVLLSDVFIGTSLSNTTKVRMVETGNDTGIFSGSIKVATTGGTIEFSQIQAADGDTLTISYIDEVNTTGLSRSVTDTALVEEGLGVGNIAGRVTSATTGAGINGATVTVEGTGLQGTTSNVQGQDGVYAIQNVPVGAQTLTVDAAGFTSTSEEVTVVTGNPNPQTGANIFNFALTEIGGTPTPTPTGSPTPTPTPVGNIAGRVTDADTGDGINGATVTVESTGQSATTTSVQGQTGIYAIQDVPVGAQTLTADAVGFTSSSQDVTVLAGNPNPQTGANVFTFALNTAGTPTPTPSPTPEPCVPVEMTASPKPLKIVKEQSAEETVTVVCGDDSGSVNRLVQATITSGKKRITVSPASALTDANGQAKFTITATKKTGQAKVKFQDATRPEVKVNVGVTVKNK